MKTAYLALLPLTTSLLWAQGEAVNARLTGTVLDPADAVVPGAKVMLSSTETGFTRQFVTAEDGRYTFTSIPPGRYQLTVEKADFKTYAQPNVLLTVGQSSTLDPRLEIGPINLTIEVVTYAPILNTGNANKGSEVSGKQVRELPLDIRNVYGLVGLDSGVNNSVEYQALF